MVYDLKQFDTLEEAETYRDKFLAEWPYVYFSSAKITELHGKFLVHTKHATSTGD
jgi:hypothetical protein